MEITQRKSNKGNVEEQYISWIPKCDIPIKEQVEEFYLYLKEITINKKVIYERIFGTANALELVEEIRSNCLNNIESQIEPVKLLVPENNIGILSGIHVYCISGIDRYENIYYENRHVGFLINHEQRTYITLSNILDNSNDSPQEQSERMFNIANSILKKYNSDFLHVARTWLWLGNILAWYGDFNKVRSNFFIQEGLITETSRHLPASTGIGIIPYRNSTCAMDLFSVVYPKNSIEYIEDARKQNSAFLYGAAFSRATKVKTFVGTTLFISGTASINFSGETQHRDDIKSQIDFTIENVSDFLSTIDTKYIIGYSLVYCKTRQVEALFLKYYKDLDWNFITIIGDVCRDDLLFEVEMAVIIN